ncbi:MAG TPA: hypothetical protein VFL57_07640, partial [Bryobacteraceae bacterium]|nr:hypothetical protein [Bryobacteraceae bacterium]
MRFNRRRLLAGALSAGTAAAAPARPRPEDLDRAAAAPVLNTEGLKSPVIIESIRLLKKDREYLVHVRSKDGAEGVS